MRALVVVVLLGAPAAAWAGDASSTTAASSAPVASQVPRASAAMTAVAAAPAIPDGRSMSEEIADKLSALGGAIDAHLGTLTLDTLDLHVDGRHRQARLSLRGGNRHLSLDVDGRIQFERGRARVAAQIDLGLAGAHLHLELPDVDLVPRSFGGEHYVEWQLPLFEGSF